MAYRYKLAGIVAALIILLDQIAKVWARGLGDRVITVISGYFDFRLEFNPGSAFGLFRGVTGARIFLTVIGIVACGAIVYILRKTRDDQKWVTTALGLVAGGAIGNVIDRILAGKVTDFIIWKIPWEGAYKEWPAFNLADSALVAGVLIMFLDIGRDQKRVRLEKLAAEDQAARKGKQKAKAKGSAQS